MFGTTRARRLGTLVRVLTEVPRHFRSPEYVLQTIPGRLVATGRQRKNKKGRGPCNIIHSLPASWSLWELSP